MSVIESTSTMERNGSGPKHTSAYGQACMQCFKAKCRCVPNPGHDSCERCLRLKKDCQPSESARRRNTQKTQESDARIAQLESKIETLLSVMQSAVSSAGSSVELRPLLNEENTSLSTAGSNSTLAYSTSTKLNTRGKMPSATEPLPTAPPQSNPFPSSDQDPSPIEAEECFNFFRSRMLPHFPFINFLACSTAWQVRQERPFLFHAIITVTSFSTQKKLARAEVFQRLVFKSALVDVESNTDLLFGILTYVAWSTDAFLGRADFLSRLIMLAISIVYDLRLFKPSPPDIQLIVALTQGFPENVQDTRNESIQDFIDKQRAVLACFVLSSNISSHFGRIDALRWTPQMEEALRVIVTNKQYPTDEAFAFQVRLQLLTQRVAHLREQHETDRARTVATATAAMAVPSFLYLKALRGQLQELRDSLSPELRQQEILIAYAEYAELYVNQVALSIGSDAPLFSMSGQCTDDELLPGFGRIECLWQSVKAIKTWLDIFYRIPPAECVGLPFHFWSQAIRCTTMLKYLSILEDPAWDYHAVRNTVNLLSVLDWMPKKLDLASKEAGLQADDDLFKLFSKLLSRSREWAETIFNMSSLSPSRMQDYELAPARSGNLGTITVTNNIPDMDQMSWIQEMDLESDKWFEDVLGC
ncbi:C6 transcription factor [Lipomyces starkeyi]